MKIIKKFVIFCRKCGVESKCNLQWHPYEAFIITCYNCGEAEGIKVKGIMPPEGKEQFDKEKKKALKRELLIN